MSNDTETKTPTWHKRIIDQETGMPLSDWIDTGAPLDERVQIWSANQYEFRFMTIDMYWSLSDDYSYAPSYTLLPAEPEDAKG
jgi:hypothetical protein